MDITSSGALNLIPVKPCNFAPSLTPPDFNPNTKVCTRENSGPISEMTTNSNSMEEHPSNNDNLFTFVINMAPASSHPSPLIVAKDLEIEYRIDRWLNDHNAKIGDPLSKEDEYKLQQKEHVLRKMKEVSHQTISTEGEVRGESPSKRASPLKMLKNFRDSPISGSSLFEKRKKSGIPMKISAFGEQAASPNQEMAHSMPLITLTKKFSTEIEQ